MRRRKGQIIGIALLCLAVVGVIVYFERFKLINIVVEGGSHYTEDEIRDFLVKSKADKFTHFFYLKYAVFSSPEPIPYIEKMEFEIIDRNTVKVTVYDKVLIGCVEHMGRYMHFDRDGIVTECTMQPDMGVPVITGISFSKVVMGDKLDIEDDGMFKRILELTLLLKKYEIECDRIHFDIKGDIKLYIDESEVLLGSEGILDYKISALKNILKASGGVNYRYDLRRYTPESGSVTAKPITKDE